MRFNKVITLVFMLLFVFSVSFSSMVFATDSVSIESFTDIPINHWGINSIGWGIENKIITGYPNNLFKPDNSLTESEFAVMLAKYASNTNKDNFISIENKHWSQSYYDELEKWELPFDGYDNDVIKDSPITRGKIATIISANYGFNLTEKQAVYFMYENELSLGNTPGVMTFESYGASEALTRAQAVQFMKNISGMGLKQMTFKGNLSTKGKQTAEKEIKGVVGVPVDNSILVDFNDFGMPAPVGSGITTKVVGGKVVVDMVKITEPVKIDGERGLFINYFDFDANDFINATDMNNSIALYGGVELPFSYGFTFPEQMVNFNGALVGVEYGGNGVATTGEFNDKESFKNLINNLSYFKASSGQIKKSQEYIDLWSGKKGPNSNDIYLTVRSKSKDSSMLIVVGDGDVYIAMYSGVNSVTGLGDEITVD